MHLKAGDAALLNNGSDGASARADDGAQAIDGDRHANNAWHAGPHLPPGSRAALLHALQHMLPGQPGSRQGLVQHLQRNACSLRTQPSSPCCVTRPRAPAGVQWLRHNTGGRRLQPARMLPAAGGLQQTDEHMCLWQASHQSYSAQFCPQQAQTRCPNVHACTYLQDTT